MVSKVAESEKKNQAIAQLLQKEQEDNQKSENSKLLQLEARMEKQLMDFDIEREQYKTKLRKEESKVRELLLQLTDIKQTVLSLQQESNDTSLEGGNGTPPPSAAELTDSAIFSSNSKVTPVSLIKSLSQTVSVNQNVPNSPRPSDNRSVDSSAQQKARMTPPVTPQPIRQSADVSQQRVLHPQDLAALKARQAAPPPTTSPKPVSQAITRPQANVQALSNNRVSYHRQNVSIRPTSPANVTSIRPQINASNTKQISQISKPGRTMEENLQTTVLQTGSTSIPTRVSARSVSMHSAIQTPNKLVNTQSNKQPIVRPSNPSLQTSTTPTNNSTGRPAAPAMSPRSTAVPPHLGSAMTIIDPKIVGSNAANVGSWRNSVPTGSTITSYSTTVNLISPPDKSAIGDNSVSKPKPPPPVRNVSLPSTKKYQSIENTS